MRLAISRQDLVQIERDLGQRSFKHFAQMAWHVLEPSTPLKWGWAMDAICDHLQAISNGDFNRLLMNVPPGTSKSTLTGVLFPAWEWTTKPWLRYLGTAHMRDLATRDSMKCRRLIQSEWYQERWHIDLTGDMNAKTKFENVKSGFRESMAFTSLTGSRGDRVLIDDPLSVDDGNSLAALVSAETTFLETLPTRVNNDQSAIVVIMQRLHERDTSGVILSRDLDYVHLCLPMEFEVERKCITPIFQDPRTVEGELLFPERFSRNHVDDLKKSLGSYGTAGQLQQRPTPRGGGLFKAEWWEFWTVPPNCQYRVIYADTAQKIEEANDYSVFECWGMGYDGNIYLLDLIRDKWESPELLVNARAFWNKHHAISNGTLRAMKIEDKSSGSGLIQTLKRGGSGHPTIPVEGIQRSRDKVSRANDVIPRIESSQVFLPAAAPFLSEYLEEFSNFPNGAHDDMIDPTMDAISDMLGGFVTDFSKVL